MTPVEVHDALDAAVRRLVLLRFDVERLTDRDTADAMFTAAVVVDGVRALIAERIGTGDLPEEGGGMV